MSSHARLRGMCDVLAGQWLFGLPEKHTRVVPLLGDHPICVFVVCRARLLDYRRMPNSAMIVR